MRQGLPIPIVLVTHSLQEASLLADKMCVLHHGKTLQLAAPEQVMNRPATLEVARLVALRNVFSGEVVGHKESEFTVLRWGELALEASFDSRFRVGEEVHWTIPESQVVMRRKEKAYRTTSENLVNGVVVSALVMGSTTHVKLRPQSSSADVLSLSVPTHFAQLNSARVGSEVSISLRKDAVHLMPHK